MEPRILIARTPPLHPHDYDEILLWLKQQHPALVGYFDVCAMPHLLPKDAPYRLLVQWLQDPLENLDPRAYHQALALEADCDARGIRVVNRVSRHENLAKSETSRRLREVGIAAPRIFKFDSHEDLVEAVAANAIPLPVIVREDVSHIRPFHVVHSVGDARDVPWDTFFRPVASEFVDVQSLDGLHRKYRCITLQDKILSSHLQISEGWETRYHYRVRNLMSRDEEIAYVSEPDPYEDLMRRARAALDVEFVGIDYGVTAAGEVVIWEANQHPELKNSYDDLAYRNFSNDRVFAAMFCYYLGLAGLEVPVRLERQASYE